MSMSHRLARRALAAGIVIATFAAGAGVFTSVAHAGVDINADADGIMLHGYDPVAYFTAGQPTKGKPEYTATHMDGRYLFASAANRDAFVKDPGRYAPQYGGYCAMGAALGRKLDGDPSQWKIVDGKLYLNVSADAAKAWGRDVPGNIAKANASWPTIKDKPAAVLNKN